MFISIVICTSETDGSKKQRGGSWEGRVRSLAAREIWSSLDSFWCRLPTPVHKAHQVSPRRLWVSSSQVTARDTGTAGDRGLGGANLFPRVTDPRHPWLTVLTVREVTVAPRFHTRMWTRAWRVRQVVHDGACHAQHLARERVHL